MKQYIIEITLPNGRKLPPYPIDPRALLMAGPQEVAARLAADIALMMEKARNG